MTFRKLLAVLLGALFLLEVGTTLSAHVQQGHALESR